MRQQSISPARAIIGIIIVLVGMVILLDNLGMDVEHFWRLWPIVIIAFGVTKIIGTRSNSSRFLGGILVLVGVLLLLGRWNLWPIVIILFGLYVLWRALGPHGLPQMGRRTTSEDLLKDLVIFGGSERVITSTAFQGGEITAVFGGIDLDLRNVTMNETGVAVIDCFVMFGGLEVKLPETWEAASEALVIFGGVEDKTRPLPPAVPGSSVPAGAPETRPPGARPRLVFKGYVLFGGIEVRN